MKKKLLSLTLILGVSVTSFGQLSKKVLFIGNSYTAVNNLPLMVSNMAINTGDVLIYDSNTPGGQRLINHAANTTTLNKINADEWDFVALQAQSQEPSWGQAQMEVELYPYAEQLSNAIRANNACSQPLFYMTWGRENGDANNCEFAPWVCTYEGMDDALRASYIYMAEQNNAEVAPAGAVWRYLRTNSPEINLYSGDGSHPSLAGTYAAACAFYTIIYKKDPALITWNSDLSDDVANTIRLAAKTIVFDAIDDWDYVANFNYTVNDNEVTFTYPHTSDDITWDFGDENNSINDNPVHTYNENGDFEVVLTINKCGRVHEFTKMININFLSLQNESINAVMLYPNPTTGNIYIKGLENKTFNVSIYTVLGQEIKHFDNVLNNTISVSDLSKGAYFLKIDYNNSFKTIKIVRQ
ncbi:T9SS type A sorting domain-containing protein [Flavobacterium arcticum]|nr:T9SS type A sorting domain-containing protein [Flavobacterium arcticum]KAF2511138.1 T9SS type A sorting domain-containing protein [Flavobacterium arcticum]